jgi:hypothetical protein
MSGSETLASSNFEFHIPQIKNRFWDLLGTHFEVEK